MDYFRLCMLHFYMAVHMHQLGLHQMAEDYIREADQRIRNRIIGHASGVNIRTSFLADRWCDYWETVECTRTVSSAQAEARAQAWAQILSDARSLANHQGLPDRSRYDITQAGVREAYRLWQASVNEPLVFSGDTSSQPVVGPAGNDEQHGLVVQEPPTRHNNTRVSHPSRHRANRSGRGNARRGNDGN